MSPPADIEWRAKSSSPNNAIYVCGAGISDPDCAVAAFSFYLSLGQGRFKAVAFDRHPEMQVSMRSNQLGKVPLAVGSGFFSRLVATVSPPPLLSAW